MDICLRYCVPSNTRGDDVFFAQLYSILSNTKAPLRIFVVGDDCALEDAADRMYTLCSFFGVELFFRIFSYSYLMGYYGEVGVETALQFSDLLGLFKFRLSLFDLSTYGVTNILMLDPYLTACGDLSKFETVFLTQEKPMVASFWDNHWVSGAIWMNLPALQDLGFEESFQLAFIKFSADLEKLDTDVDDKRGRTLLDLVLGQVGSGLLSPLPLPFQLSRSSAGYTQTFDPKILGAHDLEYLKALLPESFLSSTLLLNTQGQLEDPPLFQEHLIALNKIYPGGGPNTPPSLQDIIGVRLAVHQGRDIEELQPWTSQSPMIDELGEALEKQIKDQSEFFLQTGEFLLWAVYGGGSDLDLFLDYYSRIMPPNTRAVFILDRWIEGIDEIRAKISKVWPTLFFKVPDNIPHPHLEVQRWVFQSLYPKRLGGQGWNLFVDMDEFVPLPKSHPTLVAFTELLEKKGINQLVATNLDVWEFRDINLLKKKYVYLPPLDSRGIRSSISPCSREIRSSPQFYASPTEVYWGENDYLASCFLEKNGKLRYRYFGLREELVLSPKEATEKILLIRGGPNNRYSQASHEPHTHFKNIGEALMRYPILHLKFTEEGYLESSKLSLIRLTSLYKETALEGYSYDQFVLLSNHQDKGIGPYHLFTGGSNQEVLDKYQGSLIPTQSLFDDNLQFDLSDATYFSQEGGESSFFPIVNIDPLR